MEEVLYPSRLRDPFRRHLEFLDQLRTRDLSPQIHDAVLGVDADCAFRDIGVAEDLGLHLARERDVVESLGCSR